MTNPFDTTVAPIDAPDEEIRRYLEEAEVPPLLPAIAYVTGNLSLLREDLRPNPLMLALPQGGLDENQLKTARELAFEALVAFRDGGSRSVGARSDHDLLRILEHTVGDTGMDAYLPLLKEELSLLGEDRRAPGWHLSDVAPGTDFRVAVIGAGMSGILAAYRLQQAGVPFVILEKDADIGGTWLENTYPGCRVDNPNHNYSYAFAQRHDWPFHFSTRDVLLDYFRRCAHAFGILRFVRFGTEVLSASWDETSRQWEVLVRNDGNEETLRVDALISAVGQLNRPSYPTDVAGYGSFAGPAFHSARWRHEVDLSDKTVAVIGTGASAVQFVPEIAKRARRVVVFQRTPPWLAPTPDYHDAVSAGQRWLYKHLPSYSEFNRFWIFWKMGDGVLDGVRVDPDYPPRSYAVSAMNDFVRMMLEAHLQLELADRPDLLEKATPRYPPGAKRILRDNGIWPRTLKRPNVELVTDDIAEITTSGVRTAGGEDHAADVLVYGTGFQASSFLAPMRVTGRGGIDLHERWAGDARAYLGITVPGFPNLFCLYGPNTNIVINGSIIYFSECGVRYILGCLRTLLESGARAMDVRKDVHDEFNERVDAENRTMAWGWSEVNSWYKSSTGRVTQNWPFTLIEYWRRTLEPDPADYELS